MLTIIATGDRESDLYKWNEIRANLPTGSQYRSFDGTVDVDLQKLRQLIETVTLLAENVTLVIHQIELSEKLVAQLAKHQQDVYIITAAGKLPKPDKLIKLITEKVTDSTLKSAISHELSKLSLVPEHDSLLRLYLSLTIEDFSGKERISPIKTLTFLHQLQILSDMPLVEKQKLFLLLVGTSEGKANHWELLDHLFTTSKKKQHEYFARLNESMSTYEIMSLAKSSLFLVLAITIGQRDHLDNASIAKKIGKHPFYVTSLARTIASKNITFDKAYKLVSRMLNLETTLKSGKLDDEGIGFDFLLATSS